MPDIRLPIWQSALLSQGCQVHSAGQFFPLELRPIGDRIVCTPTVSGSLLPFNVAVTVGQPVTQLGRRPVPIYGDDGWTTQGGVTSH